MALALQRKLAVEFVGTFFLVFTVGMAVATAGTLAPLAIAAVLMVMVFAGGHISGAHYNPAVSTAVQLRGKMGPGEFLPYIATQIVAAVLAGIVVTVLGYDPARTVKLAGVGTMLVVEFLFTFALGWVVLHTATSRGTEGNSFYGLAIGFTVGAGAFAVGSLSFGVFNPAVAIGSMVAGFLPWSHIWIYLIANPLGGACAAWLFLFTQPGEKVTGDVRAAEPDGAAGGPARY